MPTATATKITTLELMARYLELSHPNAHINYLVDGKKPRRWFIAYGAEENMPLKIYKSKGLLFDAVIREYVDSLGDGMTFASWLTAQEKRLFEAAAHRGAIHKFKHDSARHPVAYRGYALG